MPNTRKISYPLRLSDHLAAMLEEAFTRQALGDRISYDLIPGMIQTPGGPVPGFNLITVIPAPTLGQVCHHAIPVPALVPLDQPAIDHLVTTILTSLRDEFRKQLSVANGTGAAQQGLIAP